MADIEIKQNNMAQYAGYKRIEATFMLTRDMLGTEAGTEEECLKHNVKQINLLPKDENNKIRIKPWWIRASLRDTSNVFEVSKNLPMNYIYDYQAEVITNGKKHETYVKSLTIAPDNKGKKEGKISTYEILKKGLSFKVNMLVPTRGSRSIDPKLFKEWISLALRQGIGSIRKSEYGCCELTDFKVNKAI